MRAFRLFRRSLLCLVVGVTALGAAKLQTPYFNPTIQAAPEESATAGTSNSGVANPQRQKHTINSSGDFNGWRWCRLPCKIRDIAASGKDATVVVESDDAIELVNLDRGEVVRLATIGKSWPYLPALGVSPNSEACAYIFRGPEPIEKSPIQEPHFGDRAIIVQRLTDPFLMVGIVPVLPFPHAVAFSPDGKRVAIGRMPEEHGNTLASSIAIWELESAKDWPDLKAASKPREVCWESGPIHDYMYVTSLQWTADGSLLAACGTSDTSIPNRRDFLQAQTERPLDVFEREQRYRAKAASESKQHAMRTRPEMDGIVRIWDAKSGRVTKEMRVPHMYMDTIYMGDNSVIVQDGFKVVGLSRKTEREIWRRDLSREYVRCTVLADGTVVVVRSGVASTEDAQTGEVKESIDLSAKFGTSSEWRVRSSPDRRAVAMSRTDGLLLYRKRL